MNKDCEYTIKNGVLTPNDKCKPSTQSSIAIRNLVKLNIKYIKVIVYYILKFNKKVYCYRKMLV